jgi:pSer/pThr/pTyr-binding forkhead associated (FHA) protein
MEAFGRLLLLRAGEPEQVFTLSKAAATVGRAEVNDIVLPDAKVSRTHARFEYARDGYAVVDQGSANGTWVNGVRVARALLSPGDCVQLGESTFRFELPAPPARRDIVTVAAEAAPATGATSGTLQMRLVRTDLPRLAVHTPQSTWEVTLHDDGATIGRDPAADIVLPYLQASRRHARIERRHGGFVLRDLGSMNGTWLGDRRLDEHTLADGDTVRIGPAHLTFKRGFAQEELSDIGRTGGRRGPRRTPVVFVPGFMGSELWRGSERVWPHVRYPLSQPEIYRLPETAPLEARAVARDMVIVPGLIKLDRYNRVADYLVEALGYERGKDVLEFAYDWRQDVRDSARRLAQAIEDWPVTGPITIIAHSMGCLVSRWYVERLGGAAKVGRLVLVGGPHLGAPRAVTELTQGPRTLPLRWVSDRLTSVLATFPSTYQLLPWGVWGADEEGRPLDVFADDRWLPEATRPMLREAATFRRELGARSSVPAVSIFGYGLKTMTGLNVRRDGDGRWQKLDFDIEAAGDETVPQRSAVLPGSEIHPVQQNHGTLYVDNDVKMRLKLELTRDDDRGYAR